MAEDLMQQLRSKATELLLREEWKEAVPAYSQFINICQDQISKTRQHPDPDNLPKLHKSLCLALSNRSEARSRLREFAEALKDCDQALEIGSDHFKTLLCKGKFLLNLNRYSMALDCFKTALLDPHASGNAEWLNGYLEKCKRLEFLSRTGAFDLSDWVVNGYRGQKSAISGRGLFATKNVDAGTLVLITKTIATERGILPSEDSGENAQLVMWKNFIDRVTGSIKNCPRTHNLVSTLSISEDEDGLQVPDISLFGPEGEETSHSNEKLDMGRILNILDVNSLVEDAVSAKVRLHVGDCVMVHASRDVKVGEEFTFGYYDALSPLGKRKEMSKTWGFQCNCKRCKFEEEMWGKQEIREIEMGLEGGMDVGGAVYRLEEGMRRWVVRGKEKGYLRDPSEKSMKRWGRRIPAVDAVVDSVLEVVGSDERLVKVQVEGSKKTNGLADMERSLKLGKGVYGKAVKKQALRALLELGFH
ncbi:hypothetical protein CIPAW_05G131500 [Carya illinoinensis]|uniref:SET domain-containing protein n=1 Tax=Carya illinoinensis TaxID=32201 RepID=A0A8T1QIK5_CARIL|nr:hypothetical protein CIPAW_05G131500 [Carya illinoinensis]